MITFDIHKTLGSHEASIDLELDLNIQPGNFITIYGPSGAGKTSTLRVIAGLLNPDGGTLVINGQVWYDSIRKINIPPQKRNAGFVFQDYALFPHMTVKENLEFAEASEMKGKLVYELMELMELSDLVNRKPSTLSGGQQQRVALARALAQKPEILLLDEPLAALDYRIRLKLQDYLLKIHREYQLTTFLVSHDISEINKLSDLVLVMEEGKIVKSGTPEEIFINQKISGKFKFAGEVLNIESQEVVFIVSVLVHNQVVKVIAQASEVEGITIGDQVMLASKAFNPVIYKID